jgi:hypothetical protein
MRTRVILIVMLIVVLVLPLAVYAQEGEVEPKQSELLCWCCPWRSMLRRER